VGVIQKKGRFLRARRNTAKGDECLKQIEKPIPHEKKLIPERRRRGKANGTSSTETKRARAIRTQEGPSPRRREKTAKVGLCIAHLAEKKKKATSSDAGRSRRRKGTNYRYIPSSLYIKHTDNENRKD